MASAALAAHGYLADRPLALAITLAVTLAQPLLLEGEAGVGKTEVARSLAEARLILQEDKVDFFILDINLPDGSGIDFILDVSMHNPEARVVPVPPSMGCSGGGRHAPLRAGGRPRADRESSGW